MFETLLWDKSLYELFWLFLIYSLLGWCAEVAAHAVTKGKFINRGFLNGPYCPIYGFGMIIVIICLTPISHNIILLFIGSVVLTTALEFITGFILEKVFKTRWWDYSNQKLNIGGYICLKYSLLWGAACVIIMKIIQPLLIDVINIIPQLVGQVFAVVFAASIIVDLITVLIGLTAMSKRLKHAKQIREQIKMNSDRIGRKIADEVFDIQDKVDKLPDEKTKIQKRLEKSYPSLAELGKQTNKEELKALIKEKMKR